MRAVHIAETIAPSQQLGMMPMDVAKRPQIRIPQTYSPAPKASLQGWPHAHPLDAVTWTALGPKFGEEGVSPSFDQVIEYLLALRGTERDRAKGYIERTPRQVDTAYRRRGFRNAHARA